MNYGDIVCESVKIIGESLLEGLQFDKSVICTIVDDSEREQGTYIVTDGSVTFKVYSENTSYRKNTVVYVTIPNGDYDNDKIITGKKPVTVNGESKEPFIYTSPFSTIIDVSGNLIENTDSTGLIANLPATYYELIYSGVNESNYLNYFIKDEYDNYIMPDKFDNNYQYYEQKNNGLSKTIFEKTFLTPYYGFTRLGIQASFMAWLQENHCIAGNYGLKLTVEFTSKGSLTQTETEISTRVMYLDVSDMLGNPYAFETYYNQEKVFDISTFGGVSYIKLEFYQDANSFYTQNGQMISYLDDFGELIFPNLFVKDCRVCLGYVVNSYDTEFVQISSFNADSFTSDLEGTEEQKKEKNKKDISLKWIHILDDSNKITMDKETPYQYEIRWYRYVLGEPSTDKYGGPGWVLSSHEKNNGRLTVNVNDSFYATLDPDTSLMAVEQVKAIVFFGATPGYSSLQSLTSYEYSKNPIKYFVYEDNEYKNCLGREYKSGEIYYIEDPDTREIYYSNILEFKNEQGVINSATLDALQALSLVCKDEIVDEVGNVNLSDTYGNYLLYDQKNLLIDKSQASITRIIGCKLNLSATQGDDTGDLAEAQSIIWRIPTTNTMIVPDPSLELIPDGDTGYSTYTSTTTLKQMTSYGMPVFKYTIASMYNPSKANNFIECSVSINGITYRATKDLTFGQSGTSGTEYTFVLDFENNVNAITLPSSIEGSEQVEYIIGARLYDNTGEELDISDKILTWKFLPKDPSVSSITPESEEKIVLESFDLSSNALPNNKKRLVANRNLTMNDILILQVTLENWGDFTLGAYLPIAIRLNGDYQHLTGATQVIYLSDGTPQYYNQSYQLHINSSSVNYNKPIEYKGTSNNTYLPTIKQQTSGNNILGYRLQPVNMFVDGLPLFAVQCKISESVVWTQPVLIIQNNYPSAMINEWSGKELVIDESKGSILGNMIGAGTKNGDNSFSGVLMGDWKQNVASGLNAGEYTGIFGFNKGQMAFSFTDDGKATIGKTGAAQLKFDGNGAGTIESGNYANSTSGLKIDFQNGTILAKKNSKDIFKVSTTSPYLTINNTSGNSLISIGDNSYFLKSSNSKFTNLSTTAPASGMEINLSTGQILANNGTFYGDLIIKPSNGEKFIYTTYTATGTTITPNSTGGKMESISLADMVTSLKSNISHLEASLLVTNNLVSSLASHQTFIDSQTEWNTIQISRINSAVNFIDSQTTWNTTQISRINSAVNFIAIQQSWNDSVLQRLNQAVTISGRYGNIVDGSYGSTGNSPGIGLVSGSGRVVATSDNAGIAFGGSYVSCFSGGIGSSDGIHTGSDLRLKEKIDYNLDIFEDFFMSLKPAHYKYKYKENMNIGFIAQDVENSLNIHFINHDEGFVKKFKNTILTSSYIKDDDQYLSLSYNDFIGLNTYMIQKLIKKISKLDKEIQELKEKK